MKHKILVVEDDPSILTGVIDLLESEGYEVYSATDGKQAISSYEQKYPDLILLDIMLPEKSGYDVCRQIRGNDKQTPIIMLTAKSQEVDKVIGLELGADDYIIKPFGIHELLARIRAVLRRAAVQPTEPETAVMTFGNVVIDAEKMQGTRNGESFDVTQRELLLLQFFMKHEDKVLNRNTLLTEIWGVQYEGTTRTLDQHIAKLRQKIEDDPANPCHIITVHGIGYRFRLTAL